MSTAVLDRISCNQKFQDESPILVNDENTANIDATFIVVYRALSKALEKKNISKEEMKYASKLLTEVYLERKAKAVIDSKVDHINRLASYLVEFVNPKTKEDRLLNCYYYNKTKHSLKHEW